QIINLVFLNICLESYPHLVSPMTVILAVLYLALCYCVDSLRALTPICVHVCLTFLFGAAIFYFMIMGIVTHGFSKQEPTAKVRTIFVTMATVASLCFVFAIEWAIWENKEEKKRLAAKARKRAVAAQAAAPAAAP
ncbi:hypothetical protein PFISCL1PPCAC_8475, partial [Pristionchus fissidentatus]